MILYFSATGNSEYVAKRIGETLHDDMLNLLENIKNQNTSEIHSDQPWIIVGSTYAWRIPRILHEWLSKTTLSGSKEIYFVMTCGGSIGNASKYLKQLSDTKGMRYNGTYPILMPDNYITMYPTPTNEEALKIIQKAEGEIDNVITCIIEHQPFPQRSLSPMDRLNSGMVNSLFYPTYVHAKKFYIEDTCISCGKCVNLCPLNNINLIDGKPIWEKHCTHCMACINQCPTQAIEYGNKTKGRIRYTCGNAMLDMK